MDDDILPVVDLTGDEALAVEKALLNGVVLVEKMARRGETHGPHRFLDCTHWRKDDHQRFVPCWLPNPRREQFDYNI